MTTGPHTHRLHPPRVTPTPQTPKDVGCVCGKYRPRVYACDVCYLKATEND